MDASSQALRLASPTSPLTSTFALPSRALITFWIHFLNHSHEINSADVQKVFSIGLKRQYTCTRRNLSSRTTSLSTSTPVASLCLLKSSTTGPHCHWSGKQLGIVCLSSGCTLTQKIESNRHKNSKILQTEEDISQDLPVLEVQSSRVCWLVQYLSWPRSGKPQVKNSRNSG